jgi:hypothetical protein
MSQGLRTMLANRRFAIPLIILLAFCLIGLILVGVVLILKPGAGDSDEPVAQATSTLEPELTVPATSASESTEVPTRRPTPTLVPLGTSAGSTSGGEDAAPTTDATSEPTATSGSSTQATDVPITDEELADTGIGWGLALFAGAGLALLAVAARRLRMAQ